MIRYHDEFDEPHAARAIVRLLEREVAGRGYRFMEFCGGHTHAIHRHGIPHLLPSAIEMIHGPGCPVCVLATGRVDGAIALARLPGVIVCCFGDTLRVPGSNKSSLLAARAGGADIRIIYSARDALELATATPGKTVVLFAIGFETTTPGTAAVVLEARRLGLSNFAVYCNHVLTPPAIRSVLDAAARPGEEVVLDGFVGPGHVSTIIGTLPFDGFAASYGKPVVIAGFEPLDVLQAILMLVRQVNGRRAVVENQYTRAVTVDGNRRAQAMIDEVFELRERFEWRGLGELEGSALRLRPAFRDLDAEHRFELTAARGKDHPHCLCPGILRGAKRPIDCKLFGTACTPAHPLGPCMVSSEGACAAAYRYRGARAGQESDATR
jgi:hydrogenase expression/formation protein HypD